ncbi:MAG: parvulin peptidyl-prolyl isomerase [Candidatus Cloacimonetes bacterium HGW-Cloacimonetes-1]|jgi:peptidyl-prolyl cis-trans isomerase C|nr:MAG: parvulin peptidyl-prolyl isomerase [Candidatus Cloacimonetes bacterium HGW-Cloacimonetes-1]
MDIVAKVFDREISSAELHREVDKIKKQKLDLDSTTLTKQALDRVIDRYLLLHKAIECGISVTDDEYEDALLEIIDLVESPDNLEHALAMKGIEAKHFESIIKNKIIIKKYIHFQCESKIFIEESKLLSFYEEQKEFFVTEEEVRASHILIKGDDAEQRALQLRNSMHTQEEFLKASQLHSDCPSNAKCGDLGFFHRGKLLKAIEDVAFSLAINEISAPFKTHYGYHILMVTDIRNTAPIPFEKLKDSLRARLGYIEREYCLTKHIRELRDKYSAEIILFPDAIK